MLKHFNPGHTLLPTFPSFRSMGMVGEACLPSNAYYPRTPDYTLYSGLHVCLSEHSDSSFVCGFMSLDYGLGTMTATTYSTRRFVLPCVTCCSCVFQSFLLALRLLRLGKRELILVLFVRLFDLRLFDFICFLFLLVSGKDCGL